MNAFHKVLVLSSGMILLASCSDATKVRPTATVAISDPLPKGALARIGTARLRGVVNSLAVAPDGSVVATGGGSWQSRPSGIQVWSLKNGEKLYPIGEGDSFASISPDSRTLATSG
jgi:hypothetical protein